MGRKLITAVLLVLLPVLVGCGGDEAEEGRPVETATGVADPGSFANVPPEHIDRIVTLFNQGVGLMEQYKPVDAVKAFEEVVRLAPDWTRGRLNLGIALMNSQDDEYYERAEEELEHVIAQDPDNPFAHYTLAMLLRHLTRFDEALVHFEETLRIDPEDPHAHYQVATLIADRDPVAAREHLEVTLEKIPHHESACYRLQGLLREAGETERARELLLLFRALKTSRAGIFSGMKYSEMGYYADVIRTVGDREIEETTDVPPVYRDLAAESGLIDPAGGVPGWPGEHPGSVPRADSFGPGLAVADIDTDGDLDLFMCGAGSGKGVLYRNDEGRYASLSSTRLNATNVIGAYFGDFDSDGDPDLFLTCDGPNRLYQNDGGGKFSDVSGILEGGNLVSIGAAWADADHDGDLDLYVANFSTPGTTGGVPNELWRNNGDGTFVEVARESKIDGGDAPTVGVLFFDLDDDRDLDLYLINHNAKNRIFLNQRVGRYVDATEWFPGLADEGPGLGGMVGDVDRNGREDLVLLRGKAPPRLWLQADRAEFVLDPAFAAVADGIGGAVGGLLGDLDLDGDLDFALLGTGGDEATRHRLLLNRGTGRFSEPVHLGEERGLPDARGAVAADIDGDGGLELLVARAGAAPELWHASMPEGRHWLEVIPAEKSGEEGFHIDPTAVGLLLEIKMGRDLQVASLTSSSGYLGSPPPRAHFGLGEHGKVDYVRLSWPDGVLQSELEVTADQVWQVPKVKRKPSSCPILFAWDGERFAFVTDFLGVGGVGFFITPGVYAPPDPTEDVRIPPEQFAPREGRYELRIAEPLEEVSYLDEMYLLAYDHPSDWEVHPDERFTGSEPFPTGRPFAVAEKIFPVAATDHHGEDVHDLVLEIDRRYFEPPRDPRFVGYADDHWIELDFGDRLRGLDPDARLVLYLYGWVEYTYSHVNYAAYQAGISMTPPSIEVPDESGCWTVAVPEAGFPAGLPRMMTLDISQLPIRGDGRFRICTNMEIFSCASAEPGRTPVPGVSTRVLSGWGRPHPLRLCPPGSGRSVQEPGRRIHAVRRRERALVRGRRPVRHHGPGGRDRPGIPGRGSSDASRGLVADVRPSLRRLLQGHGSLHRFSP
jgi:hypothetical protein